MLRGGMRRCGSDADGEDEEDFAHGADSEGNQEIRDQANSGSG